jgi:hypothetical protein
MTAMRPRPGWTVWASDTHEEMDADGNFPFDYGALGVFGTNSIVFAWKMPIFLGVRRAEQRRAALNLKFTGLTQNLGQL